MPLVLERYRTQVARWPAAGKVILAQWDATTVVVHQAFRESIARFAVEQRVGSRRGPAARAGDADGLAPGRHTSREQ